MNLVARTSTHGGKLTPLYFNVSKEFPSLINPSVFSDETGTYCIIRNVNYVLWHSEYRQKFSLDWGTLSYLHPETEPKLKTQNWFCTLDESFQISSAELIDTSQLDVPPLWEFVGLEDARLVRWNNAFVAIGVRRDVKPGGEGRMELSTLHRGKTNVTEVSRVRTDYDSAGYCEKNWMPIVDMPYHFIRWVDPLEIIEVNPTTGFCTAVKKEVFESDTSWRYRGGSQVVPCGEYRVCVIHEVDLTPTVSGRKNGRYVHRIVIWDKQTWALKWVSESFSFLDTRIEFCCGLAIKQDCMVMSFGASDNCSFIYTLPLNWVRIQSTLPL